MIKSKILQIEKRLKNNEKLDDIKTFFNVERAIYDDSSEKITGRDWAIYSSYQLKVGKKTKEQLNKIEEELRAKDKIEYDLVISGSDGKFLTGL